MVTAIRHLEELAGLDDEWRALAERRGNAFVTPEWFRCWFDHYGDEFTPLISTVTGEDGRLIGLLPLVVARSGRPRTARIAGANLGDRFHPVCEPADEPAVAAAAGEALASADQSWSVLALEHAQVDRPWISALAEATGTRLRERTDRVSSMPLIDLSRHASWDDFLATRSKNTRQQVRRFGRRAAKEHSVRLRRTEDRDRLASDMEIFFDLHERRQVAHGGSSLGAERARALHSDFAAACHERGWLRLSFLEFDERPVAALYAWRVGDRYSYYNSGFDPDFAKLSPGLILLSAAIESALEEGAAVFDFLLGDERYKFRFTESEESVSDVTLARAFPHPASLVVSAEHWARRVGRRIPSSVRRRLGLARRSLLRGRGR